MPGKRAKILSAADVSDLLVFASCTRQPLRNTVIVLLSADSLDEADEVPSGANVTVLEKRELRPRTLEALWWWQFSYLSTWGQGASGALRALQSLVAHVRLEVPIDVDAGDPT